MKQLRDILSEYRSWIGSRAELISVIEKIEQAAPASRMLQSKKAPYDRLPVNARRIQWFISMDMMPKPSGHKYDYAHLVFYWAAITARKRQRLTFQQIEGLATRLGVVSAERYLFEEIKILPDLDGMPSLHPEKSQQNIKITLADMGREEGRPLKSKLVRFALTPWCHVHLNENKIAQLSPAAADVLVEAFRISLNEAMVDAR